jgi:hypothetical protein
VAPVGSPVLTGDTDFRFVDIFGFTIGPPSFVPPRCRGPVGAPCFYDISWSELDGRLESLSISLQNGDYNIGIPSFGLTGGGVATDFPPIGGCPALQGCQITGFWQQPVSEPVSASLLLSGLLGLGLTRRFRRPCKRVVERLTKECLRNGGRP